MIQSEKIIETIEKKAKLFGNIPIPEADRLSDTTNAELVARMYGDVIRYDHKRKRWLVWNGQIWQADQEGQISKYVIDAMRYLFSQAENLVGSGQKLKVAKWAIQSESKVKIDACLGILKILPPVSDTGENWDSDTMLLSCPNGIVDLRTGELRNGRKEDRITKVSTTNFYPNAECPRWIQFLNEIFPGDAELIHYIHKVLGYSVTGNTSEQIAFFCYGSGANGKSVTFKVIRSILGDYGVDAPSSLLKRSYNTSNSNDLASIEGRRFLVSSETLSTSKINEERLKALTGGDEITARELYKEYFSFTPVCHIWLFMNHRPQTEDDSFGFWRRIRCIPFKARFTGENADKKLSEKLEAEKEGILNWLIEGCLLWQKEGLDPTPQAIDAETLDYQSENDDLYDFLQDLTGGVKIEEIKSIEMYQKYVEWTTRHNFKKEDVMTKTALGRRLSDRFEKVRKIDGNYYKNVQNPTSFVPECIVDTPISINSYKENYIDIIRKRTPNPTSIHSLANGENPKKVTFDDVKTSTGEDRENDFEEQTEEVIL